MVDSSYKGVHSSLYPVAGGMVALPVTQWNVREVSDFSTT